METAHEVASLEEPAAQAPRVLLEKWKRSVRRSRFYRHLQSCVICGYRTGRRKWAAGQPAAGELGRSSTSPASAFNSNEEEAISDSAASPFDADREIPLEFKIILISYRQGQGTSSRGAIIKSCGLGKGASLGGQPLYLPVERHTQALSAACDYKASLLWTSNSYLILLENRKSTVQAHHERAGGGRRSDVTDRREARTLHRVGAFNDDMISQPAVGGGNEVGDSGLQRYYLAIERRNGVTSNGENVQSIGLAGRCRLTYPSICFSAHVNYHVRYP